MNNELIEIKGEIAEKSPFLKKFEKKKGIVKIGFDEEKTPLQNIKTNKKLHHKPQEQEIQEKKEAKLLKNVELASKIVLKEDDILFKNMGNEKTGMGDTEVRIEDLEKEIKEKKKLLKLKKQEEERKKEEEKLKQIEAEQQKVTDEINTIKNETVKENIQSVKLALPFEVISLKICPKCSAKLKRKKVKQQGFMIIQEIKCKNKMCDFHKEIILKV